CFGVGRLIRRGCQRRRGALACFTVWLYGWATSSGQFLCNLLCVLCPCRNGSMIGYGTLGAAALSARGSASKAQHHTRGGSVRFGSALPLGFDLWRDLTHAGRSLRETSP